MSSITAEGSLVKPQRSARAASRLSSTSPSRLRKTELTHSSRNPPRHGMA
ncbi:hypothetical protein ABK905_25640 [Acerihabitans sp. KWT182]|uniref:Uncharacterized protein n=1 Tax=Acerihabitans sp. KWT182 TaxID=3157919 RepID=A0AAU7QGH9_9GAMM